MVRPIFDIYGKGKKFKLLYEDWPIYKYILVDLETGESAQFDTFHEAMEAADKGVLPKPEPKKKFRDRDDWLIFATLE